MRRERLNEKNQRDNQAGSENCGHPKAEDGVEAMPAGSMRNKGWNEQGKHNRREEPARAKGKNCRQRCVQTASRESCNESWPAWLRVVELNWLVDAGHIEPSLFNHHQ